MRIVIIGGVAAGASAAVKARRADEECEIVIYERGATVSYANCGMPYHIGGVIADRRSLIVVTAEFLKKRFNVDALTGHEVTALYPSKKTVTVREVATGRIFEDRYDRLIIATGASPVVPDALKGETVFSLYTLADMDKLQRFMDTQRPGKALVLGGGFIGLEMAENFQHRGMDVTVVEKASQLLLPFDPEMAAMAEQRLLKSGLRIIKGVGVSRIEGTAAILENGAVLEFDLALASLGVRPNSELAKAAGLELGIRGAVKVNELMQTSDPDIYCAGDAAENYYRQNGEKTWIPLAGSANKQGRIAGHNAVTKGVKKSYKGTLGTAIIKYGEHSFGVTGFTEKALKERGTEYHVIYHVSDHHAGYYPGARPLSIKVISDVRGRLLGAQVIGSEGVDKRIDVYATAIYAGLCFEDLESLDLAYAPPFSSAKDPVIISGMIGNNVITGEMPSRASLPENPEGFLVLDVRTPDEHRAGAFEGSVNIPLDTLRDRIGELDPARRILVHCATGLRSYVATRCLINRGFKKIYNLTGGYYFHKKK